MFTSRVLYSSSFYLKIKSLGLHASTFSCRFHEYLVEIYKCLSILGELCIKQYEAVKESSFNLSKLIVLSYVITGKSIR